MAEKIIYTPIFPIAPGETLQEILEERNMKQAELARRMDRPFKFINEIVKGKTGITAETALQLEKVLGVPARVWTNLEANYQEAKARIKSRENLKEEVEVAKQYPYLEMAKLGWLPMTKDPIEKVNNLLSYFGVASLNNVIENQLLSGAMYRRSYKKRFSTPAAAAWLRRGLTESQSIETATFDSQKLSDAVKEIRNLTTAKADEIHAETKKALADCGVAFVVTESLKNAPINGISRWVSADKALIQLSIFNKFCDIFWFSLFHEIGHLMHHGKKETNIDLRGDETKTDKEKEADNYASEVLIPEKDLNAFLEKDCFTIECIKEFAKKEKIDVGIVIGRLQYLGKIPYKQYSSSRPRFTWVDN